ncbi:innexin unc-9-like [Watersipora subatra]|uniref:innexin unc-9-like n=1 Tax=Watersipora subatra TaxID=2589382 RepID=UPI00355AE5E7
MPVTDIDASYMFYSIHEFISSFSNIRKFAQRWDEDLTSKLNSRYSVILITMIMLMISTKQYVGDPIACMAPSEFTFSMVEYTNHLCWVSNTYYVSMEERPPMAHEKREHIITYYQWIPLILIVQGIMFYLPSLLWRVKSSRSGLNINKISVLLSGMENLNPDVRDKVVSYITKHIDRALRHQQVYRKDCYARCTQMLAEYCSLCCGKTYGNYLASLHLLCKLLYTASSIGQLFLLGEFIGDGYIFYGIDAMRDIIEHKYHNSKMFPRVTLCDVNIRQFSNVQLFTIQCALPINLFNEKVYLVLWFWLCAMSLINILSLVCYLWNAFIPNRRSYVEQHLKRYLKTNYRSSHIRRDQLHRFVCHYLRQDGTLILRMLESNTNNVIIAEVIGSLWQLQKQPKRQDKRNWGVSEEDVLQILPTMA